MKVRIEEDFCILYGSQTGQAQAISEEIFDRSFKEGLKPVRFCLSQVDKKFSIEKLRCVVIVCSTTGEGEPPDTVMKFARRIKKKTLTSRYLQNLSYTILGLGDSNYTNFCCCSRAIDTRLQELGATRFYETGYADDAVGLEEVVEPWVKDLYPALRKHLQIDNTDNLNNALNISLGENIVDSTITEVNSSVDNNIDTASKMASTDGNVNKSVEEIKPTLKFSVAPLCDSALKIPSSPAAFLEIKFLNDEGRKELDEFNLDYPGAATGVKEAVITAARQLTFDNSVKKALELELDITGVGFDYEPGDSFGIICENKKDEVDFLVQRLKLEDIPDKLMTLEIMANSLKKAPTIPQHIPLPSTLRSILKNNVDFRAVPRKALLRMLVDYTENEAEKRRLQELCSTQGSKDYNSLVREKYIGLIQLLQVFQSCSPPVERVLELLPQLLPREYSVASCCCQNTNRLKFVFNVIELPEFQANKRFGLCTDWLDSMTSLMRSTSDASLEEKIENITLQEAKETRVKMYFRRPTSFRFPEDPSQPLIMIGPGTGVAPYIGFLQKREFIKKENPSIELGEALLFFGCRYKDKDFLYREELLAFKECGILTELYTSFSRDETNGATHTKYVQENIREYRDLVLKLIFEKNGAVFICGDAKHMGRDVSNTFVELIQEFKNVSKMESIKIVNELREKKQFLEDVWT